MPPAHGSYVVFAVEMTRAQVRHRELRDRHGKVKGADALMIGAYGGFLVGQCAARSMVPKGRGSIFFTGATASVKGVAQSAPFAIQKFALRGLAQCSRDGDQRHVILRRRPKENQKFRSSRNFTRASLLFKWSAEQKPEPKPITVTNFLKAIHEGACREFETVLGPEANEEHRSHFHLDLNPLRSHALCE
jgi:hypothetical protein